ncbi:dehydrogenase/reductase SDR family member on chromosome X-like [Diorhabda carinulata]|uniref:dehydrogenase/reductase SDR family member on chromosome X-like n=1 Tax=Diorhabda carinulata TaxID=1163345 RepID=UPI0025A11819|nr:dehydrogenase/reductase SDR family member on chromosome X-like [Diorhabda carinulata]
MIFLVGCTIIILLTVVAIVRSKKPLKTLCKEAKYDLVYNYIGSRAILQDIIMRGSNKIELSLKSGKNAIITGGTRGIGLEVIRMLLKSDINVIIGCRNVKQGELLLQNFRNDGIKSGNIDVINLDISVMDSVRNFAKTVREKYSTINYLINNAGIMFGPYIETRDGYESQFSTNYLGHFLLTHLTLPLLKAAGTKEEKSRIVNVSSCAHIAGEINFDDINNRHGYIAGAAYAQSKMAQILFTKYLDKILQIEEANVQVHAVHPGIVNTDLFNGTNLKKCMPLIPSLIFKSPLKGAVPIIYACLSPYLEGKGGTYIVNCKVLATSNATDSEVLQEELFNFTNKLLNITAFGSGD